MLFKGRNQIPYGYGRFGYTRGGGKVWHGGQDIVGLDSAEVLAPFDGVGLRRRIITDKHNLTWEWGNYVTIQRADGIQVILAHLALRLVQQGQRVKAGQVVGVMGNTGNAAGGYKHVHCEARTASGKVISPVPYSGVSNAVGTYGTKLQAVKPLSANAVELVIGPASEGDVALIGKLADSLQLGFTVRDVLMTVGPASPGDQVALLTKAQELGLTTKAKSAAALKVKVTTDSLRVRSGPGTDDFVQVDSVKRGEVYTVLQALEGWYYIDTQGLDGWVSSEYVTAA